MHANCPKNFKKFRDCQNLDFGLKIKYLHEKSLPPFFSSVFASGAMYYIEAIRLWFWYCDVYNIVKIFYFRSLEKKQRRKCKLDVKKKKKKKHGTSTLHKIMCMVNWDIYEKKKNETRTRTSSDIQFHGYRRKPRIS